jgi:hypothetical protein
MQPELSNIYDPIKIRAIVADKWLKDSRLIQSGIAQFDGMPIPAGTLVYQLRNRRFQDVSGQSVAAGGTVATVVKTQEKEQHPRIWRYGSTTESSVLMSIEEKDAIEEANATMAADISNASTQFLDDALVAVMKGVGAANTGNQVGSGALVTLAGLVSGLSVAGERGLNYMGGGMAMNSAVYWYLAGLGMVAATSNTFGNMLQDKIVQTGNLPTQLVGMTPIVSDKFTEVSSKRYYVYFVQRGAVAARAGGMPVIESASLAAQRQFGTVTNFYIDFGLGIQGMSWKLAGKETVTDTELATAANWELAASSANQVGVSRLDITVS